MRQFLSTIAVLAVLFAASAGVRAQQPEQQEGVEVLARGPVHEGYAEVVAPRPQAAAVIARRPPELIEEMPADQRPAGDNVQWIPGYWAWDEDRSDFLWVSGFWRVPPPDRQWVPGHWDQADGGWQWVPGFWAPVEQQQISYLPPPPAPVETAPAGAAPDPDSVFIPGTWVYRETRYLWRPGTWVACRPGWVWVPAHYVWTPCGYVFVDGYWDYALRDRGLLFAPVAIDVRLALRPRWYYQPCYVVSDDCLLGALFVRPAYGHYYFGDYFEARYRGLGFTAWFDFRIGRDCYDPLFSYYRWHYRGDRRWEGGLRDLYAARYEGRATRPPRTLVQQNTLVKNITINKTTVNNVTNIKNVSMLSALSQVDRKVKLQPVSAAQRQAQSKLARQVQDVGAQRTRLEAQVRSKGIAPVKPTDRPQVVKLKLPAPSAARTSTGLRTPPPLPVKPEARLQSAPVKTQPNTPPVKVKPQLKPQPAPAPGNRNLQPVAPRSEPKLQPPAPKPAPRPQAAPPRPSNAQPGTIRSNAKPPAVPSKPAPARPAVKPQPAAPRPESRSQPPANRSAARPAPVPSRPAAKPQPAPTRAAVKPQAAPPRAAAQAPRSTVRAQPAPPARSTSHAAPARPAPQPRAAAAHPKVRSQHSKG
jgi:hypothetical protein